MPFGGGLWGLQHRPVGPNARREDEICQPATAARGTCRHHWCVRLEREEIAHFHSPVVTYDNGVVAFRPYPSTVRNADGSLRRKYALSRMGAINHYVKGRGDAYRHFTQVRHPGQSCSMASSIVHFCFEIIIKIDFFFIILLFLETRGYCVLGP